MRPVCFVIGLLAAVASAGPCAARPEAQLLVARHDFGERFVGELPPAVFSVANRGNAPLLLRPRPCCGLSVTGTQRPIPPGATRQLVVTTPRPPEGLYRKTLRVGTNDPKSPELQFELVARIKAAIQILPGDQLAIPLQAGNSSSQIVTLRSNDEPEFTITSIRCSESHLQCKEVAPPLARAADEPRRYRAVEVTLAADGPATAREGLVVIGTTCKRCPEVTLHVFGLSNNGVTAHPPRLDFVPGKGNAVADLPLFLSRASGPFKILGIATSDPRAKVKVLEEDPTGLGVTLLVSFWANEQQGVFQGTITIRTDDPDRPVVVVPYSAEAS
jgi:hypothetical protein